jgi:hypothetical protein
MSNEQFLRAASRENLPEVVASILSLAASLETKAVKRLLYLSAANQPADHIPAIIALLRRRGGPETGAALADLLIAMLAGNRYGEASSTELEHHVSIVSVLRSATMERDATRVLEGIGERGRPGLVLDLMATGKQSSAR